MPNFLQKAIVGLGPTMPRKVRPSPAPGTPGTRDMPQGRGTLSGFTLGVSPLWGQPYPEQVAEDASGLISRQRMREIVMRTPTAAACMNAILDFAGGVKIDIRNVDPSQPVPKVRSDRVKRIMRHPNPNQTTRQFLLTLMRDIITFGYGAIEIVQTGDATRPVELWVMDSARIRIDFNEHGLIRGYDMLNARGAPIINPEQGPNSFNLYQPPAGMNMGVQSNPSIPSYMDSTGDYNAAFGINLHGWEANEVIFFSLNPISESMYPHSRIVQLFTAAVLEDLMIQFIADRFTDSNIPFGVFDLGDVTETELKIAIDNWNAQGKLGNRILMTGSKGSGSKWTPFGYHLKDLEAVQLLQELRMKIMGIFGVTMQELGESQDINKSNGYNLSFTFKKRAVEPLLDEITQTLSKRLLWDTLGYTDLEQYYEEIDSRDDFLMSQIDNQYQRLGDMSINEIRNRKGLTSIPGGDDKYVFTGNAWVPVDMLRDMAEQLIRVEEASTAVASTGPESAETVRVHANAPTVTPGGNNPLAGEPGGGTNGHSMGAAAKLGQTLTGRRQ